MIIKFFRKSHIRKITNGILYLISGVIISSGNLCLAQITVPYYNDFDHPSDSAGWSHYAISGTDDWQMGAPGQSTLSAPNSSPNVWMTDTNSNFAPSSNRALESPWFNLTNTAAEYVLTFYQQRYVASTNAYGIVEFKTGNSGAWTFLDAPANKKSYWQTTGGFSGNAYPHWSTVSLASIQGQDSVKFRFRWVSFSTVTQGWLIDDFAIKEEEYNLHAIMGDSISVSQNCSQFTLRYGMSFYNQYYQYPVSTITNIYLSNDPILDSGDSLIAASTLNTQMSNTNLSYTFNSNPATHAGTYYLLFYFDSQNTLEESDETDNIGYAILQVDSVYPTPYISSFEDGEYEWSFGRNSVSTAQYWERSAGYSYHLENTHYGEKAWHTSSLFDFSFFAGSALNQYITSQYFDLSPNTNDLVLSGWYKVVPYYACNNCTILYSNNCSSSWTALSSFPLNRNDEWDYINVPLSTITTNINNVRFRLSFSTISSGEQGAIFDDLYIGCKKPDLSIERCETPRFTSTSETNETIEYYLVNSGLDTAIQSITAFYWSTDSLFDYSDIFLGNNTEQTMPDTARIWSSFSFIKPTTQAGKYYIFYFLDTTHVVDEMREYNNAGYFVLIQEAVHAYPYFNDFETQIDGWMHEAYLGPDEWTWGIPAKPFLDTAFSGTKVFITKESGFITPRSRMLLYSPIYNMSNAQNPVLEFDMKISGNGPSATEEFTFMNLSYSTDGGKSWNILDTTNKSYYKWYYYKEFYTYSGFDKDYYNYSHIMFDIQEKIFAVNRRNYEGRDCNINTKYILSIPQFAGIENVIFRYNLTSPKYTSGYYSQGAMIDNFSIKEGFIDLVVPEKKSVMSSSLCEELRFNTTVRNVGNYFANEKFYIDFFLSSDTIIDGSDYFLSRDSINLLRPRSGYYLNEMVSLPSNICAFKYLLFNIDATNTISESNESNNTNYWPLALDSIASYPYFETFDDSIVNGWQTYTFDNTGAYLKNKWRFRNQLAPDENTYGNEVMTSGYFFTDHINNALTSSLLPYLYLQTPVFDLSKVDSIYLSFDMQIFGGSNSKGANMEYSTDGGNSWEILSSNTGSNFNWYSPNSIVFYLNSEPGWFTIYSPDSVSNDISFLKGNPHVVFRYKMRTNSYYSPHSGLRINDFLIDAYSIDYAILDSVTNISGDIYNPTIDLSYSIQSSGQTHGRYTTTKFYWSTDSIFDISDQLVYSVNESPIAHSASYDNSVTINYPTPITQQLYYVFCFIDGDSALAETDENNNTGYYKINFLNYDGLAELQNCLNAFVNADQLFIFSSHGNNISGVIEIFNVSGEIVFSTSVDIHAGLNSVTLPSFLASATYLIRIKSGETLITLKYLKE